MNEATKKKILGNKIYPVYRRIRFIRYKKRLLKQKRKSASLNERVKEESEKQPFGLSFRINRIYRLSIYAYKRRRELRAEELVRLRARKSAEKLEKFEVRQKIKEKKIQDRQLEKQRNSEFQQQNLLEKKIRKAELRQLRKERWAAFRHEIKTFDRNTLRRWFKGLLDFAENKDKRHNFFVISVNSLVFFLLSYMVIYVLSQLITVWVATTFDYKTIFYYYKIYYDIESNDWNADSVKILYSILPLNGILLGTIFIILYSTFRNEPGNFKLFFLWGFVHGMVMFFGSLLMGTLLNKDFGWVIAYMYYRDTGKMIFSIISIFALVAIGGIISKSFLISGNSYFNFINKKNRKFLLSGQVIFPIITGSFILALIKIPNEFYFGTVDEMYYEFLKLSTLAILVVPLIVAFRTYDEIYFDEEPRKIFLNWKALAVTVLIILAFRFGLVGGITFGG